MLASLLRPELGSAFRTKAVDSGAGAFHITPMDAATPRPAVRRALLRCWRELKPIKLSVSGHDLKALGVRLAIDDFGTGYSSLAYLHRFPVDVLKIDKIFIDRFTHGGSDAALGRGIVGLANSLGLQCVAEGIEHAQQAAQLRAAGCGFGQGFYFAKPLGADEAIAVVEAQASGDVPRAAVAGTR